MDSAEANQGRNMKFAVLWASYTDYLGAELGELHRRGHHVKLACAVHTPNTEFATPKPVWMSDTDFYDDPAAATLSAELTAYQPDVLLVCGWHIPLYRTIAKQFAGRCTRIMFMDNCWNETPRQWLGRLVAPRYIKPLFEGVFVPGERQAQFARCLGFTTDCIAQGGYTADTATFVPPPTGIRSKGFAFCGRLVPSKGIDILAQAYANYRATHGADALRLVVCGKGAASSHLDGAAGVDLHGFVTSAEWAAVLSDSSFLVLPSIFEPWGLVVHEAALTGCGVIASDAVGASVHLVRHLHNGRIVQTGSVESLTAAMTWAHLLNDDQLTSVRTHSVELANQFSVDLWAQALLELTNDLASKRAKKLATDR